MTIAPRSARDAERLSAGFMRQRRIALLLLFLAYMLSITDRQILPILFESIKRELSLSDTQLGLLSGLAFASFYATLGVPIAMVADRGHRRTIIAWSLAIFSVMSALCGSAQSFWQLALTRFGVGIGEAGVNPSSHSILADYYPPEKRSTAMSVIALGANAGIFLGLLAGGRISQIYGWRVAFVLVGLPGVLLAVIVHFFLKEAPRGLSEARSASAGPPPPVRQTVQTMWANRAMRHLVAASTVSAMGSYGVAQWQPAFFMRSYGLSQTQAGLLLGVLVGVVGGAGAFTGGWLTDRLQARHTAHGVWMIGISQVCVLPLTIAAYLAGSPGAAAALFVIPVFVSTFYLGPSLALIQSLARLRMRAVASAIKMLLMNLIGLGLGPALVGIASDALRPTLGHESLRGALLLISLTNVWSGLHFYLCGRHLAAGLEDAKRDDSP